MIATVKSSAPASPTAPGRLAAGARHVANSAGAAVDEAPARAGVDVGYESILYQQFAGQGEPAPAAAAAAPVAGAPTFGSMLYGMGLQGEADRAGPRGGAFRLAMARGASIYEQNMQTTRGDAPAVGTVINRRF